MKQRAILWLTCAILGNASAQSVLNQGDTFTYSFSRSDLTFEGTFTTFPMVDPRGTFDFVMGGFEDRERLRYEMFEDSLDSILICSGTKTVASAGDQCSAFRRWQDGQGAVRVTMISGTATLTQVYVGYTELLAPRPAFMQSFGRTFVPAPVPEPGSAALLILSFIAAGLRFRLQRINRRRMDAA